MSGRDTWRRDFLGSRPASIITRARHPERRAASNEPGSRAARAIRGGRKLRAALIVLACISCGCATTTTDSYNGAFTFSFENDAFTGSDNNYSNGIVLGWATNEIDHYDPSSMPRKWARFWSFLPFVEDDGYENYASWTLAQEVHTPDKLSNSIPPADDQPYAGVLYLDNALHARDGRWGHTWNLRLGVVGPSSKAEQVQRGIHNILAVDKPQGWTFQLPDEPIVNVDYTARYVLDAGDVGTSASWRLVSIGGASVGNYLTGLNLGFYSEFGWNLAPVLPTANLRRGFSAASVMGAGPQEQWSFSFFTGATAYGIAHYLPLDGTLFRNSRSVDSKPYVGIVTGGISLRRRSFVISLSQTYFTETFERERENVDFGELSLSWYF